MLVWILNRPAVPAGVVAAPGSLGLVASGRSGSRAPGSKSCCWVRCPSSLRRAWGPVRSVDWVLVLASIASTHRPVT